MFKRSSQILGVWFLFWDLALTAAAWVGAYFVRFDSGSVCEICRWSWSSPRSLIG
jgi:hypothetical protein